jgi:hypothetical protein
MVGGTWVCCGAMHIYFSRHRTLFFPERLYKLGCTLLHVTTLPLLPASPTLHERAFVRWRFIAHTFSFNEVIDQRCLVCSIGFFPFVLLSTISRRPPDRVCARFRSASSLQKLPYRNNYQKQINTIFCLQIRKSIKKSVFTFRTQNIAKICFQEIYVHTQGLGVIKVLIDGHDVGRRHTEAARIETRISWHPISCVTFYRHII